MRHLVLLSAVVLAVTTSAPVAGADCIGPSIDVRPLGGSPGEELVVTGRGWGDNCYDTGPPPEGQGVLGRALDDIEIVFSQGAGEWVVATGSANPGYEFEVTVRVPRDARPGDATVAARAADGRRVSVPSAVVVTEGGARPGDDEPLATFGTESGEEPDVVSEDDDVSRWLSAVAAVAVLIALVGAVALGRRRRRIAGRRPGPN